MNHSFAGASCSKVPCVIEWPGIYPRNVLQIKGPVFKVNMIKQLVFTGTPC
jgi:hypothetical protein